MKKIFALTLIFLCLSITTTFAYENPYPLYWNDDKNFPIIWGRMGRAIYLDKSSIKVNLNDPPFYIISGSWVWGPGKEELEDETRNIANKKAYLEYKNNLQIGFGIKFFYDEKEKDMRYASGVNKWIYVRHGISYTHEGSLYLGEAIFYVAIRKKFYGGYLGKYLLGYDRDLEMGEKETYFSMFDDSFYELLDGKLEDGETS